MTQDETTRELSYKELAQLLNDCKKIEDLRVYGLNNPKTESFDLAIKQAKRIRANYKDIAYKGIRVESGYDRQSQNFFCVSYVWRESKDERESFWALGNFEYTGHIDSAVIAHIWMILDKLTLKEKTEES
jgi:hypothetical protein